jgi:PKD repeat protein
MSTVPRVVVAAIVSAAALLIVPSAPAATGELASFGASSFPPTREELYAAGPVALEAAGGAGHNTFVADLDDGVQPRIRKFGPDGTLLAYVSPTLAEPGSSFIVGLAIDEARDRLYALVDDDTSNTQAAREVLVFDTAPDCTDPQNCTLVAPTGTPSLTDGVLIDFPATPTAAVAFASGIAVDPSTGDVVVLGIDDAAAGDPNGVLQRIGPDGTPGARVTGLGPGLDPDGGAVGRPAGLAIGPDGSLYVAPAVAANASKPYDFPFGTESVYKQAGGTGPWTLLRMQPSSISPLAWAGTADAYDGAVRWGSGSAIAVSRDGDTLFLVQGDATAAYVRGFSTTDGTLTVTYGGGTTTCAPTVPHADGQGPGALSIAAGTGDTVALTAFDWVGSAPGGTPVVRLFGPGGSGCGTAQPLFTVDGAGTLGVEVTKGEPVTLDASVSQLLGGVPTSVAWDLDGSHQFATGGGTGLTLDTRFVKAGTVRVGVRIAVDGAPALAPVFHDVTVVAPPPTAAFFASAGSVAAGATVAFDASASLDPTGAPDATETHDLKAYRWDFGDGATQETSTPKVSHAFANAGTADVQRTVELTVVSHDDVASDTAATRTVTVGGTPAVLPLPPAPPDVKPLPPASKVVPPTPRLSAPSVDRHGTVSLKVSCPKGTAACVGKVVLTTKAKQKGKTRTITLNVTSFRVAAGQATTFRLRLSKANLKRLKSARKLSATATVTTTASGQTRTAKTPLTLKAPQGATKR